VSKEFTKPGCYHAFYTHEQWDAFMIQWGVDAPAGKKAKDAVDKQDAKTYTERVCTRVFRERFVLPVSEIIKGFQQVIPQGLLDTSLGITTGRQLQTVVEGDPVLNVDSILSSIAWAGGWTSPQASQMKRALMELDERAKNVQLVGESLDPRQEPLRRLMAMWTGLSSEPPGGWPRLEASQGYPLKMYLTNPTDKYGRSACTTITSHTCFNRLDVPAPCLNDYKLLMEKLELAYEAADTGYFQK